MTRLKGSCGKCVGKFETGKKKGSRSSNFTAQRVDNASLIQKTTAIVGGGIATVLLNRLKKMAERCNARISSYG